MCRAATAAKATAQCSANEIRCTSNNSKIILIANPNPAGVFKVIVAAGTEIQILPHGTVLPCTLALLPDCITFP